MIDKIITELLPRLRELDSLLRAKESGQSGTHPGRDIDPGASPPDAKNAEADADQSPLASLLDDTLPDPTSAIPVSIDAEAPSAVWRDLDLIQFDAAGRPLGIGNNDEVSTQPGQATGKMAASSDEPDTAPSGVGGRAFNDVTFETQGFSAARGAVEKNNFLSRDTKSPGKDAQPDGPNASAEHLGSDVPLEILGEFVHGAAGTSLSPLSNTSGPLINIDEFRADPRFAGIDGAGYATVIIDTGIDLNHPFFGPDSDQDGVADRIVYQFDFADNDADASDVHGHGSNVSSIVASSDSTFTGIAPGADIIHLKVFSDSGSGNFGYLEDALEWVVDNAATYNIASVNMSLGDGGNFTSPQGLYGIADQMAQLAALDVIAVSASGNSFFEFNSVQGVQYPAADPNSLSVGAVFDSNVGGVSYTNGAQSFSTDADHIAPFSQRDDSLSDIFAPGAPITGAGATGGTVTMHGTSQAAPHIAGLAVLAQQLAEQELGRRLTVTEFDDLLAQTGVLINDGDDENDNVSNTGLNFSRVDALALADAIVAMGDPTLPTISIADTSVLEGDSGSVDAVFTVTLSDASSDPVSVDYSTASGTANGGEDFTSANGTLVIPAGQTSGTIAIEVSGDNTIEPDESFTVTISNAVNGQIIGTTATGTIQTDDFPPSLSVSALDAVKAEGNAGTTAFTFAVARAGDTSGTTTVDFDVTGGARIRRTAQTSPAVPCHQVPSTSPPARLSRPSPSRCRAIPPSSPMKISPSRSPTRPTGRSRTPPRLAPS